MIRGSKWQVLLVIMVAPRVRADLDPGGEQPRAHRVRRQPILPGSAAFPLTWRRVFKVVVVGILVCEAFALNPIIVRHGVLFGLGTGLFAMVLNFVVTVVIVGLPTTAQRRTVEP
jgi:hypothetical protein